MPDQTASIIDAITQQALVHLKAPLLRIAEVYQEGQEDDGDWSWDTCDIVDRVWTILTELGVIKRCEECNYDFAWSGAGEPETGDCPQWDGHTCSGGCGNTNDECTCNCCSNCGYYDCECPECENCEETIYNCSCREVDKMWPDRATL